MNKKAVVNQIFMYILGLFLISIILLYGYNSVQKLMQNKEKIELVEFQDQLTKAVKSIMTDYNSVIVFDTNNRLLTPDNFRTVCIVDNKEGILGNIDTTNTNYAYYQYFKDTYEQQGDKSNFDNVYVFSRDKKLLLQFNIGVVEVKNNEKFFCIPVSGYLSIRIRGLGDHVEITQV